MGSRHESPNYLIIEEEEELAKFLVHCTKVDYDHSLSQVLSLMQRNVDSKGIEKMMTRGCMVAEIL